jgi:hypothetical protein
MAILGLNSANIAANAGAAFENGLGVRAYGLGQAMTAEASDSTAVFWNPAGLSRVGNGDVGILKYDAFETAFTAGQAAMRVGNIGVGFGYIGASVSGINHTVRTGSRSVETGETSVYAAHGLFLGAGTQVWGDMSAGVTVKYLMEDLAGYQATGFGMDLGLQYPVFSWLDVGMTVQNLIAPQMAWNTPSGIREPVRMTVRPGVAMQLSREIRVMSQVDWRESRGTQLLWGAEYWPMAMLVVRGGYNAREFALGTGVKLGGLAVDMTWSTAWTESVPDTYRVGMGYSW